MYVLPEKLSWTYHKAPANKTADKVAICNMGDHFHVFWRGPSDDKSIYWSTFNCFTRKWAFHNKVETNPTSNYAPAVVGIGYDGMKVVYTGTDNYLYQLDYFPPKSGSGIGKWKGSRVSNFKSDTSPSITAVGHIIYLSWREPGSNFISIAAYNPETYKWEKAIHPKNGKYPVTTIVGPQISAVNDTHLLIVWTDSFESRNQLKSAFYDISTNRFVDFHYVGQSTDRCWADTNPDMHAIDKNQVMLSWKGLSGNNKIYYTIMSWNPYTKKGTWDKQNSIDNTNPSIETGTSPALGMFLNEVFLFFRLTDGTSNFTYCTAHFKKGQPPSNPNHTITPHGGKTVKVTPPFTFSNSVAVGSNQADSKIVLVNIDQYIHMIWKGTGTDQKVYAAQLDTKTDSWQFHGAIGLKTKSQPAAFAVGKKIMICFLNQNKHIMQSTYTPGGSCTIAKVINKAWSAAWGGLTATGSGNQAVLSWASNPFPEGKAKNAYTFSVLYNINQEIWSKAYIHNQIVKLSAYHDSNAIINDNQLLTFIDSNIKSSPNAITAYWTLLKDIPKKGLNNMNAWRVQHENPQKPWEISFLSSPNSVNPVALNKVQQAVFFTGAKNKPQYNVSSIESNLNWYQWTLPIDLPFTNASAKLAPVPVMVGDTLYVFWTDTKNQIYYCTADL